MGIKYKLNNFKVLTMKTYSNSKKPTPTKNKNITKAKQTVAKSKTKVITKSKGRNEDSMFRSSSKRLKTDDIL